MNENREQWLAKIDAHREAQTCSICGQHLDYSEGCYTITHAHWRCHKAENEAVFGKPEQGLSLRIANGGHYVHAVDLASGRALCGHQPRDTATHMRQRGRWVADARAQHITCPACMSRNGGVAALLPGRNAR